MRTFILVLMLLLFSRCETEREYREKNPYTRTVTVYLVSGDTLVFTNVIEFTYYASITNMTIETLNDGKVIISKKTIFRIDDKVHLK